ncbi:hypothetical protein DM02DRAFT_649247 [Periconia macrospinosa]|uniref:Protein-lysine N-methyltransferase EFM5 n=1 Tax=Periconia macrospinosa TaxID=97972 RepID=A0A2V1E8P8_9PLEO|nr:hypothetical protein DM02DRAFT_649247 [Periconia macrospinosa]
MGSIIDDDDDIPQLSSFALEALQGFYTERDQREKQFEDLKAHAEDDFKGIDGVKLSMEAFTEDWNASQFWYHDDTATTLARKLLDGATDATRIAVISAPSVFIQVKNLLASEEYTARPKISLLEFDQRFAVFPEFVPYDFQTPFKLPGEFKGAFDRVILDPPFLSQDCQTKAALTVRWMAKSWTSVGDMEEKGFRLIVCTGERMEELITKLYAKVGTRTTSFEPRHAKGLSNEFRCYANFECKDWSWA